MKRLAFVAAVLAVGAVACSKSDNAAKDTSTPAMAPAPAPAAAPDTGMKMDTTKKDTSMKGMAMDTTKKDTSMKKSEKGEKKGKKKS